MLAYAEDENMSLAELAMEYESARAGISEDEVFGKMRELVIITKNAIHRRP